MRWIMGKIEYAEYVKMTEIEYDKLVFRFGKFRTEKAIYLLNNYKGSKGKKYKSDYHTILNWVMDEAIKKFPVAQLQVGEKEEQINREGLKKLGELTKDLG